MKYYHEIKSYPLKDGSEYTYDSGYNISELPIGKPVYGFAYDVNDDTLQSRLRCLPVLGEINKRYQYYDNVYSFFPYKKGTSEKRNTGSVDVQSRMYADTYEEAIEMYNELVQKRIDNLYCMIKDAEQDKIKE